ncbi:putative ribonuclease H protein [Senna tora]|uniref:Putative ribonuclease H protein n=1 Tax=Senna tora TaxID=362788 RepID=A0A834WVF5_9FABA|nr:putative ribonuclease H protein [Senna tora]
MTGPAHLNPINHTLVWSLNASSLYTLQPKIEFIEVDGDAENSEHIGDMNFIENFDANTSLYGINVGGSYSQDFVDEQVEDKLCVIMDAQSCLDSPQIQYSVAETNNHEQSIMVSNEVSSTLLLPIMVSNGGDASVKVQGKNVLVGIYCDDAHKVFDELLDKNIVARTSKVVETDWETRRTCCGDELIIWVSDVSIALTVIDPGGFICCVSFHYNYKAYNHGHRKCLFYGRISTCLGEGWSWSLEVQKEILYCIFNAITCFSSSEEVEGTNIVVIRKLKLSIHLFHIWILQMHSICSWKFCRFNFIRNSLSLWFARYNLEDKAVFMEGAYNLYNKREARMSIPRGIPQQIDGHERGGARSQITVEATNKVALFIPCKTTTSSNIWAITFIRSIYIQLQKTHIWGIPFVLSVNFSNTILTPFPVQLPSLLTDLDLTKNTMHTLSHPFLRPVEVELVAVQPFLQPEAKEFRPVLRLDQLEPNGSCQGAVTKRMYREEQLDLLRAMPLPYILPVSSLHTRVLGIHGIIRPHFFLAMFLWIPVLLGFDILVPCLHEIGNKEQSEGIKKTHIESWSYPT